MINKSMSNYQLFRMFLQFVATSDWNDCPLTLADRNTYPSLPPIDDFKAHYSVVFLDSSGYLNVTWNMTSQQYQMVKREAAISHAFLDGGDDGFQYVFLKPVTSQLKYDSLCKFTLHLDDVKESPLLVRGGLEGVWLDNGGWVWPKIIEEIEKIVIEGFDGRVQSVVHCIHGNREWKLGEAPPTLSDCHVTFYFLFNPNTFDPLILGPPANTPQASSFRHFWGECSELRKYADGSIHEAVLWTGEGEEQKRTVPQQIINHLLKRHVGVVNDVIMSHRILDSILSVNGSTGEELSVKVVKCYIELSRQLRQLKGLPLAVATVQGASPVFSHSEVTPPPPWSGRLASKYRLFTKDNACSKQCMYPSCKVGVAPYIPHLQVLIHMESSGKWPDDPSALSDMKTLFYMEMAKSISKQYQLISVPSIDHLDVLKEGYVFRISIVHPHEVSYSSIVRPTLLTSTISGYCNQFPTYSLGVRLCKKWVWSHLLANHIPEEVIELMVVHLFLSPSPYTPPGSALCVLVRFLDLLKSHDWSCDPLIVNLGNELSDDKIKDIKESFTRDRHNHSLMFIATPLDHTSQLTKGTPTPPVLHRLITLAHKSLDLLTNQIDSLHLDIPPDFEQIFRTPMDHYDVLIHLKHKFVAKTLACEDHAPPIDPTHLPVVGFDPAHSYLKALEAAFSDYALFFYDKCSSHVIAVVWKPAAFEPRPFKVHGVHACTTHKREGKKTYVVPNKETLMKDFLILGEGLVDKIDSL
jgi:U3 small nucleolar RNA-associated protein 22